MQLENRVFFKSATSMDEIESGSMDLVVTSPPYPMIEMWDNSFSSVSVETGRALQQNDGNAAFESMHRVLDSVWSECFRVLKPGSFACINVGDATRTMGEGFRLYPNHSRITMKMIGLGFECLPIIHWFKPTNSPTKYMGSGMLPAGAYVTLEHEYILIFRKGGKRVFNDAGQKLRRRSAFFWEERNLWFSDVWNLKGVSQPLAARKGTGGEGRNRSGAFAFELPHRLINMYSLQGDKVIDPFMGTGTTLAAAVVNGRECCGYETEAELSVIIKESAATAAAEADEYNANRLQAHTGFIKKYQDQKGAVKYTNQFYGFPVVTRQETALKLPELEDFDFTAPRAGLFGVKAGYS